MKKHDCISQLCRMGITYDDAFALRRAAMTLHRWFELECGDSSDRSSWAIERDGDEPDSPPYMVTHTYRGSGASAHAVTTKQRIPDRETGARKRITAIMEKYPDFIAYIQGDPRGAPLWIVRKDRLPTGIDLDCHYTNGTPVYK
jgi:hypothetical protein